MRSTSSVLALMLSLAAFNFAACAPAEDSEAGGSADALSGGSRTVESSVVFLYDPAAAPAAAPACVGTLLGDKVAVTAKSCAKTGLIVGRAAAKNGKSKQGKVSAVHVPQAADAEIAIIEIDTVLGGSPARLTNAPLRENYSINSFAAAGKGGIFSPEKGEASSIRGRLASETDTQSTVVPEKGKQICAGDIGAAVCSTTSWKIPATNYEILGTCGLSGIIVGADAVASTPAPAPGTTTTPAEANGCSGEGWKMAQLGPYAEFIRQYAPDAFKPFKIADIVPVAPLGLWGYKTGGKVAKCTITTPKLDPVVAGKDSKVTAKVSFSDLQERAVQFGRFGIATKAAPTQIRWFPASAVAPAKDDPKALETIFEGEVPAVIDGDYIVSFRASATSGESWTQCDTDGIENGFSADKALELKVSAAPGTTPTAPAEAAPQNAEPPAEPSDYGADSDYGDPSADEYASDEEPTDGATKKKKAAAGCSMSTNGSSTTGLPMLGLLLGVAVLVRRRR